LYAINISVNVAAPALACAGKLWEMGSRNPVEVLQGMIVIHFCCNLYTGPPSVDVLMILNFASYILQAAFIQPECLHYFIRIEYFYIKICRKKE